MGLSNKTTKNWLTSLQHQAREKQGKGVAGFLDLQLVRGAPELLSKKCSCCKYPTKSHPMRGTPESKDAPREKRESVSPLPPAVTPPSIYVLSKSAHTLNMSIELRTTTSLHSISTSALLDSGATGMFVN